MAQGQAGTGKTTAMFLIMMNRIDKNKKYPQVLCLVPTIELAFPTPTTASVMACNARIRWMRANNYSICKEINNWKTFIQFSISVFLCRPRPSYRWTSCDRYTKACDWHDERERIWYGENKPIRARWCALHLFQSKSLEWFQKHCWVRFLHKFSTKFIVTFVYSHRKLSTKCQTMLFSTTYSVSTMEKALNFVKDPIVISLPRELELPQNITQFYGIYGNQEEKYQATLKLFKIIRIFEGIIFCNVCSKYTSQKSVLSFFFCCRQKRQLFG